MDRQSQSVEDLAQALSDVRSAIASLEPEALGMVTVGPRGDDDFGYEYPVRDELLAKIDKALRTRASHQQERDRD